jgi:hypothetical protein
VGGAARLRKVPTRALGALRRSLADATAHAVSAPTRATNVHNMGDLNLARAVLSSRSRTRTESK